MIAMFVVCSVIATIVVTPESFYELARAGAQNPAWGLGFTTVFLMVLGWVSNR